MKRVIGSLAALLLTTGIASAQDWNIEAFGGIALSNNLLWDDDPYDVDAGATYGLGFSKNDVFVPNLEIGFELSYTKNEYSCCVPNYISGLAGLVTARYNFINNGPFTAYGGIGLGAVQVSYYNDPGYLERDIVMGGQAALGARYAVSDRLGLFVEARYLSTFSQADVGGGGPALLAEFNATNIVFGVRSSF